MKPQTAKQIIIANRKAIEDGLAPPYTKHELGINAGLQDRVIQAYEGTVYV